MKKKHVQCVLQRAAAGALSAALILGIWQIPVQAETNSGAESKAKTEKQASGTVYYVSNEGNDENTGTSPEHAWNSLKKVNETVFKPGDQILFECGNIWENQTLSPQGSGTEDAWITIGSYEGDDGIEKPQIAANAQVKDAVSLHNQEYWEISDLDISNTAAGYVNSDTRDDANGSKLADVRGVHISGDSGDVLSGFYMHDLKVHDVTGLVYWIGDLGGSFGETSSQMWPGVWKETGWDDSKRTGGIVMETLEGDGKNPTTFQDVRLEDSELIHNSFGAFTIKQWRGSQLWSDRSDDAQAPEYYDPNWKPHSGITVKNNYVDQTGIYNMNGIYVTSAENVMIEQNVVKNPGVCGIETYFVDNAVIQDNEVYGARPKPGGSDRNGIDADRNVTNTVIQYNYVHDNGDGLLLCGFEYNTVIVRYNVIANCGRNQATGEYNSSYNYLRDYVGNGRIDVYNNVFWHSEDYAPNFSDHVYNGSEVWDYRNNIFYNTGSDENAKYITGKYRTYENNSFYGVTVPSTAKNSITDDPKLMGTLPEGSGTSAADRVKDFSGLIPSPSSPLKGAGVSYEKNSGYYTTEFLERLENLDYSRTTEIQNPPAIGLFEVPDKLDYSVMQGHVTNASGMPLEGASVTITGTNYSAVTDSDGYYCIRDISPLGRYTAEITHPYYKTVSSDAFEITATDFTTLDIVMETPLTEFGTLSGTVTGKEGPLADAALVLTSADNEKTYEAVTDEAGAYTFDKVSFLHNNYTLSLSKEGYMEITEGNLEISPGTTITKDFFMSVDPGKTTYLINEDFESCETGTFTGNDLWQIFRSSGNESNSVEIVEEDGRKYLKIAKENGSENIAVFNKQALNASGIITVEARVKRSDDSGNYNQFGIYGWNQDDFSSSNPTGLKNPVGTIAFADGKILSHNVTGSSTTAAFGDYQLENWNTVRLVINLDTKTFDIYIDDMETPKGQNQPLRVVNRESIDGFEIFSSSGNTGDFLVDYFRVCTGTPYDYDDADLIGINADGAALTPSDATTYQGTVTAETESISLLPLTSSGFAKVTVNGTEFNGTDAVEVPLQIGENTISVIVTAENGDSKEYTVKITRESPAVPARLTDLQIEGLTISPEFSSDILEYTALAESGTQTVTLKAAPAEGTSITEITVNGISQGTNLTAELKDGENVIEIKVSSADGTNSAIYKITVTKTPSEEENPGEDEEKPGDGGQAPGGSTEDGSHHTPGTNPGSQNPSADNQEDPSNKIPAVQTGDTFNIMIPAGVMAASLLLAIRILTLKRKKIK